jgi:hypothetical protein
MNNWYPKLTNTHDMYIPSMDTAMYINDDNFFQVTPITPMNQANFNMITDKDSLVRFDSNSDSMIIGQTIRNGLYGEF